MEELYQWMFSIEGKTGMYIGYCSLDHFMTFINGYTTCMINLSTDKKATEAEVREHYYGFIKYVEEYYRVCTSAKGWNTLIQEHTSSEQEALEKYYQLLHAYYDNWQYNNNPASH